MSRSSSNGAKGAVFLVLLLLASASALGQTPNPPGGSSGGGGTGCTTAGSNGDVLTDDGAGGCNSDGSATLAAGALGLGSSGVVGTLTLGNATSGTITLGAVAGALGTVTASLPANSGTLAELNLAQSWPAVQTFASPVLNGTVTGTGVSQAASASTLAQRDASGNLFGNNLLGNAASTVSAGGTTTLTVASAKYQALTGSSAQTFKLPDATTLSLGPWFVFNDNSSGVLSVVNAGSGAIFSVPAGGVAQCGPTNIGSANGSWDCHSYLPSTVTWGTSGDIQVNNVLSTTPGISTGASSSTSPAFKPQRGTANTGYSGDSTHLYGVVGGTLVGTMDATGLNLPTGEVYKINGSQITCSNLSGGCALTVGGTTIGSGTANGLLYDNAGVLGNLATVNSGVLVTSGAGAPSISTILPDGLAMGTPLSLILTNATGLPISTGVSGLATGIATWLGTPSSANLRGALTDETGTGLAYFQGGDIGTPSAGVGTNLTSLNASNLASGTVPAARGGAGTVNGVMAGNGSGFVSQGAATGLSDYVAGTSFTPTFTSSGTPPTGVTYSTQTGRYLSIGKLVWMNVSITLTSKGSGATGVGRVDISASGISAAATNYCSGSIQNVTFTGSPVGLITGSTMQFQTQATGATVTNITWGNYSDTSVINVTCMFEKA